MALHDMCKGKEADRVKLQKPVSWKSVNPLNLVWQANPPAKKEMLSVSRWCSLSRFYKTTTVPTRCIYPSFKLGKNKISTISIVHPESFRLFSQDTNKPPQPATLKQLSEDFLDPTSSSYIEVWTANYFTSVSCMTIYRPMLFVTRIVFRINYIIVNRTLMIVWLETTRNLQFICIRGCSKHGKGIPIPFTHHGMFILE